MKKHAEKLRFASPLSLRLSPPPPLPLSFPLLSSVLLYVMLSVASV